MFGLVDGGGFDGEGGLDGDGGGVVAGVSGSMGEDSTATGGGWSPERLRFGNARIWGLAKGLESCVVALVALDILARNGCPKRARAAIKLPARIQHAVAQNRQARANDGPFYSEPQSCVNSPLKNASAKVLGRGWFG